MLESLDSSGIFPIETEGQMNWFVDKNDPDYLLKKREFYNIILTAVSQDIKKFADHVMHSLLHRAYIASHRWPSPGSVIYKINALCFFIPLYLIIKIDIFQG